MATEVVQLVKVLPGGKPGWGKAGSESAQDL